MSLLCVVCWLMMLLLFAVCCLRCVAWCRCLLCVVVFVWFCRDSLRVAIACGVRCCCLLNVVVCLLRLCL